MPIYYGEKYIPDIISQIEECLAYLEGEYYIELLLVNDAPEAPLSQKWTSELVRVISINSNNKSGIHGARVKGLMHCQGEYVLFLDQDDKISPIYFCSQLQVIGNSDAVICKALNGEKEVYLDETIFKNLTEKEFVLRLWNQIVSPGQVLIRKHAIPNTWIQNIIKCNGADDWFLWICMMSAGCRFALNNNILYKHVLQGENASNNIINMLKSEQELLCIIQEKELLSKRDYQGLMEGFFKQNLGRTNVLYFRMSNAERRLDALNNWIRLKGENIRYVDYLLQHKVKEVAIYGCGVLGEEIYIELKESIQVKCFIDRNAKNISKDIPVYTIQDAWPKVDAIIITLTGRTEKVKHEIQDRGYTNIFVLNDWIKEKMILL